MNNDTPRGYKEHVRECIARMGGNYEGHPERLLAATHLLLAENIADSLIEIARNLDRLAFVAEHYIGD